MKLLTITIALALTACSTVGVYAPESPEAVHQAKASGLPVHEGGPESLIQVEVHDLDGMAGHAYDRHGCKRAVRVDPAWASLGIVGAHEIGHALGLTHHKDPENLMHRPAGNNSKRTTNNQRRVARAWATILRLCELD